MAKSPAKIFIIFLMLFFSDKVYRLGIGSPQSFEPAMTILILLVLFVKYNKYRFTDSSMFFVFFAIFLNSPNLYAAELWGISLARFICFISAFALSLILGQMLQLKKPLLSSVFYTFFIVLGLSYLSNSMDQAQNLFNNASPLETSVSDIFSTLFGALCGSILAGFSHSSSRMCRPLQKP